MLRLVMAVVMCAHAMAMIDMEIEMKENKISESFIGNGCDQFYFRYLFVVRLCVAWEIESFRPSLEWISRKNAMRRIEEMRVHKIIVFIVPLKTPLTSYVLHFHTFPFSFEIREVVVDRSTSTHIKLLNNYLLKRTVSVHACSFVWDVHSALLPPSPPYTRTRAHTCI